MERNTKNSILNYVLCALPSSPHLLVYKLEFRKSNGTFFANVVCLFVFVVVVVVFFVYPHVSFAHEMLHSRTPL